MTKMTIRVQGLGKSFSIMYLSPHKLSERFRNKQPSGFFQCSTRSIRIKLTLHNLLFSFVIIRKAKVNINFLTIGEGKKEYLTFPHGSVCAHV